MCVLESPYYSRNKPQKPLFPRGKKGDLRHKKSPEISEIRALVAEESL
jgi:hypothetical protein